MRHRLPLLIASLLCAISLAAQRPHPAGPMHVVINGVAAPRALQASDLRWRGCWSIPETVNGHDTTLGWGLAVRYVNGAQRFILNPWELFEVAPPAVLGTDPTAPPLANVTNIWPKADPNTYALPHPTPHITAGGVSTYGLYWDEPTSLLWFVHGRDYNTNQPFLPTIGAASLEPTLTVKGIWGLSQRSAKMLQGGFVAVPPWFAAQYTQGRRLAAGFGGYFSVINTGPVSMGPALTAFDPVTVLAKPTGNTSGPHTPLVGYPFIGRPYVTDRAHRDTDVVNDYDGWKPRNGVGYWTWNDTMWEGAAWIDTPTRSGVLFAPTMGNGRGWYYNSTLHSDRGSHAWLIYDPADLAKVAQRRVAQWRIQPAYTLVRYPGVNYPLPGWQGGPPNRVFGMVWDAQSQLLYIGIRQRQGVPLMVHVYDVA